MDYIEVPFCFLSWCLHQQREKYKCKEHLHFSNFESALLCLMSTNSDIIALINPVPEVLPPFLSFSGNWKNLTSVKVPFSYCIFHLFAPNVTSRCALDISLLNFFCWIHRRSFELVSHHPDEQWINGFKIHSEISALVLHLSYYPFSLVMFCKNLKSSKTWS